MSQVMRRDQSELESGSTEQASAPLRPRFAPGAGRFSSAGSTEPLNRFTDGQANAPLKTAEQSWTRDFQGGQGAFAFRLQLHRQADGRLDARYFAQGGSKEGWPLEGTIRTDGRFALEGLSNDAHFTGRYTGDNTLLIERFRKGGVALDNFELRSAGAQVKREEPQTRAAAQAVGHPEQGAVPSKPWSETISPKMAAKLPALQEAGFLEEAGRVAQRLGVPRDMLLAVMAYESADWRRGTRGLDPKADNQLGYYGMTQIGDGALESILRSNDSKTLSRKVETADELPHLSAVEQLQYIEIYFKQHGLPAAVERAKKEGRQVTLEELYMANLGGSANKAHEAVWTNQQRSPTRY